MLVIKIPEQEFFDQETDEFITVGPCTLKLEHSLVSISKWETTWKKPFLTNDAKSPAEFLDYIRCMTMNQGVPDNVYALIGHDNLKKIEEYILDPATATTVVDRRSRQGKSETPTSELIYYWMITNGIPFECERWRLNRLITLIRVCNAKGNPQKMSQQEIFAMNTALNNARLGKGKR